MTITAARGAKGKCDVLFSKIIRSKGYCEGCGSTQNLQTAHIVSRRYSATRCDLANAYCACATCHRRWTDWPVEFAEFIDRTIGRVAYDELHVKSLSRVKVDWEAELERLKPLYAAVSK